MVSQDKHGKVLILGTLLFMVLLALLLNHTMNGQDRVIDDNAIQEEILDCDYCTFNYLTPYTLAYTHLTPDGNRVMEGKLDILNASHLDIELTGTAEWVLAAGSDNGSIWAVITEEGKAEAFEVTEGSFRKVGIDPSRIHPESPPILMIRNDGVFLLAPGLWNESVTSHPIILPGSGRRVFIDTRGYLVFRVNEKEAARLKVNALHDARLLMDEKERILLLTDPTDEYGHGALGDDIEAASITLVSTAGTPEVSKVIYLPDGNIVEGVAPIWTDVNGDGAREIIVTVSNRDMGAKIIVYDETGNTLASGPAVGQGYRWRHQIAAAPFGPEGETGIADVLTPHIGGTVEFYSLEGDELRIDAVIPGYSSHLMGSRNLDMAIAGDLDRDGTYELLVPSTGLRELALLKKSESYAHVRGALPLVGKLSSNIAAMTHSNGNASVGVGTDKGILRIWY